MAHPYTYEDIARYEAGEMDANVRIGFEALLVTDADLRQQLALYREVQQSLTHSVQTAGEKQQLQQTLSMLGREYFHTPAAIPARTFSLKNYLRPVAGVAAAAVIALCIWQPWQPDLFTSYARTQMVAMTERGADTDTLLHRATLAFNKADYTDAARLLNKVVQQDKDNSFASFYYALSLLQLRETGRARELLLALNNGSSAFTHEAAFYLALSYVRENNKAEARKWLQRIPQDAVVYEKATRLLREL